MTCSYFHWFNSVCSMPVVIAHTYMYDSQTLVRMYLKTFWPTDKVCDVYTSFCIGVYSTFFLKLMHYTYMLVHCQSCFVLLVVETEADPVRTGDRNVCEESDDNLIPVVNRFRSDIDISTSSAPEVIIISLVS